MSATTVRPRRSRRVDDGDPPEYRAALHAFAALGSAGAGARNLDELLGLVTATAADAVGVRRCALYLAGERSEVFDGRAGHPEAEIADDVRRLTVGGPCDAFTREIVVTAAPVLIRDTRTDPRGAQSALRAWKVRAVLGAPLLHEGEVLGVVFFDNAEEPHPYAPVHVEI